MKLNYRSLYSWTLMQFSAYRHDVGSHLLVLKDDCTKCCVISEKFGLGGKASDL